MAGSRAAPYCSVRFDARNQTARPSAGSTQAQARCGGALATPVAVSQAASTSDTTNLITLDNTGYTDLAGNAGSGTTDSNNYAIDTQRPTATIALADSALGVGQTTTVTITFTEAVTGFDNADVTVENGTLSNLVSADGGVTWTGTFTPTANIEDATNIITIGTGYTDLVGNAGTGATSGNYTIDTRAPTLTITDNVAGVANGPVTFTFTFSEAVTGFTADDINVTNGTKGAFTTVDGLTYTLVVTPTGGEIAVSVPANAAQDAAGNNSTAASATQAVDIGGVLGALEAHRHMAHGRQVVDLVGLHLLDDADQVGAVGQVAVVQREVACRDMGVLVQVVDTVGVKA